MAIATKRTFSIVAAEGIYHVPKLLARLPAKKKKMPEIANFLHEQEGGAVTSLPPPVALFVIAFTCWLLL